MALDKSTSAQLKRFATAFKDARERGANESDTVMYLIKFFEEWIPSIASRSCW